jgi:ADP-ribosylglycohydrolase
MDKKDVLKTKLKASLYGLFIGDTLSMPVHWFYRPSDIKDYFGRLVEFKPAPESHPSSIMNLSNTGAAGRGSQRENVIGDVILKSKRKFWGKPNAHYHQGMKAGDNTLNVMCAKVLMKNLVKSNGKYDPRSWLNDYISFMTANPEQHNDTYAEGYHRDFFKKWSQGVDPMQCAGEEGHDTPSMGGVVSIPIIAALFHKNPDLAEEKCIQHMYLTHQSTSLELYVRVFVKIYCRILNDPQILNADGLRKLIYSVIKENKDIRNLQLIPDLVKKYHGRGDSSNDSPVVGGTFSSACYIDHSMPALLYLAFKYADSTEEALIANTNVGGENCHRGAVLGSLLGAAFGQSCLPQRWVDGLVHKDEICDCIEALSSIIVNSS